MDEDRAAHKDLSAVRDRPRMRGVLPCGSRVCLHCHKQCGAVMAAYLSGRDEEPTIKEEDL